VIVVGDGVWSSHHSAGQRVESAVAHAVEHLDRRETHAVRRRVGTPQGEGQQAGNDDGRAVGPVAEVSRTDRHRVGHDDVGGLGSQRRHESPVLTSPRPHEVVLDVEGDRRRALQRGALGVHGVQIQPVVEVRLRRKRNVGGAGGPDHLGEPGAGDEAHPVTSSGEMPRYPEKRCDVAVDRCAGEDDGQRHAGPWDAGEKIRYYLTGFTTVR
jgi:hypothetical protein